MSSNKDDKNSIYGINFNLITQDLSQSKEMEIKIEIKGFKKVILFTWKQ